MESLLARFIKLMVVCSTSKMVLIFKLNFHHDTLWVE